MQEFDEKKAVAAMKAELSPEAAARISNDELLNVIDIIWDWYEDSGLLDINADAADDEGVNVPALVAHVRKTLAKDKLSPVAPDEVEPLVLAELRYEASLEAED